MRGSLQNYLFQPTYAGNPALSSITPSGRQKSGPDHQDGTVGTNKRQKEVSERRSVVSQVLGKVGLSSGAKQIFSNLLSDMGQEASKEAAWVDNNAGWKDFVAGRPNTRAGDMYAAMNAKLKEDFMSGKTGLPRSTGSRGGVPGNEPSSNTFDKVAAGLAPAYQQGILQDLGAIGNATPGYATQQQQAQAAGQQQQTAAALLAMMRQLMGQ